MHCGLVLFDNDGTLINTGGAGLEAIRLAAHDLYGDRAALPELDVRGATDAGLARDVLTAFGSQISPATGGELYEAYLVRLREQLGASSLEGKILPGVCELLDVLEEAGAVLGLLTGNIEAGAQLKLQRFGLDHYFAFGAFGHEHVERDKLGPVAVARATEVHQRTFSPSETVVVGDTPRDISCGHAIGARTIAVATGSFSLEQLRSCDPTLAVRSLEETGEILGRIKGWSDKEIERGADHGHTA